MESSENSYVVLPEGTVTFLFTDIEGSTKLLDQLGESYAQLLSDHHLILRDAFKKHDGREIDTQGDSFFVSFPRATDAVAAVVEIQRSLAQHMWQQDAQVRVRMGLHTGEPWLVNEGYIGMDVHRAARIAHVGYGGQVLLSETTTPLVRDDLPTSVNLLDLGYHVLKDIRRPEHIHQLVIEDLPSQFPPIKSLEALPPSAGAPELDTVVLKRDVGPCPYRGLIAFQKEDAPFFFGREAFTELLEKSVKTGGLVAVIVGPSGSGKSSVVFAGLLPRLHEDSSWCIVQIRPGGSPFLSLAGVLVPFIHEELQGTDLFLESKKLSTALITGELSLHHLVEGIQKRQSTAERFLLIIDQFEELFTLTQEVEERRRFMDELLDASEKGALRHPPSFVLLLTLRADFMGQALADRPFADALQEGSLMLGPMNRAELKNVIEKPAELQGAAFETGLVERLLDDVGYEPGNLPLLEFALTLLWERMDVGWMTHSIYDEIGRVDGALARYADEIYTGLDVQGHNDVRRAFIQLIQPGQGTEDTRRVATRDELAGVDWSLMQFLADKRLIVTGRNEAGVETVELVHEALIRSWDQLRRWIDSDRAFRNWQEGLRANLRQWEETGHDKGAFLRGAPLAQAEEWLANRPEDLSPSEAVYIEASLEHSRTIQSRRVRRRRFIFAGLAIGLVLALILAAFALSQRNSAIAESDARATQQAVAEFERARAEAESEARATQQGIAESEWARAEVESDARATQQALAEIERSRAEDAAVEIADQKSLIEAQVREALARNLASYARDNLSIDPQLSLLLALEASRQTYSEDGSVLPEAQAALHQSIQDVSRLVYTIPTQDSGVPYINFTADGSRLIARYFRPGVDPRYSPDGTSTLVWDVKTGDLLYKLPEGVAVDSWPATPVIGIVDLAEDEIILNLWNPIDGTARPPLNLSLSESATADDLSAVMLSSDASRLVAVWYEGLVVQVWDLETVTQTYLQILWLGNISGASRTIGGRGFFKIGVPSYATISMDDTHFYSLNQFYSPAADNSRQHFAVWNSETGEFVNSFAVNIGDLGTYDPGLALSPDEKMFGIIADRQISIQDSKTGERLTILFAPEDARFNAIAFSPDNTMLAATTEKGIIKIWNVADLADEGVIRHILTLADPGNYIHDLQFSPDGLSLATASSDGAIKLWNIGPRTGLTLPYIGRDFVGDEEAAVSIALDPDGNRIAAAGQNGFAAVYDLELAKMLFQLGDIQLGPVEQIYYSPDGSIIATCKFAGPFQIWDADTGNELFRLDDYTDGACSFDFQPDGTTVFLGFYKNGTGWHQEVLIPKLESGLLVESEALMSDDWLAPHGGATTSLDFNDDSSSLVVLSEDGELFIWDTEFPIETIGQIDSKALLAREERDYTEALSDPTNHYLAVARIDGSIRIMDLATYQFIQSLTAHEGQITAIAFSPDGRQLATSGLDRAIRVWAFPSGELFLNLPDQTATITDLYFSPDGKRLYTASDDGAIQPYVLDIDELIELAQSKVTRSLTDEECQQYPYAEVCSTPRSYEIE